MLGCGGFVSQLHGAPGEGDHFRGPPVPTHTLSLPLPLLGLERSSSLRSMLSPGPPPGLRPRPRLTLDSNFTEDVSSLHLQRTCQGRVGLWAPTQHFLLASFPGPLPPPSQMRGTFILLESLSHVRLFATPWAVARQAPLSMGFSRQEHWSGVPSPPPGHLPDPGIEPASPTSPALAGRFFTTEPPGKSGNCKCIALHRWMGVCAGWWMAGWIDRWLDR